MNKKIIITGSGLLIAAGVAIAILLPVAASKDNASTAAKTAMDSLKSVLHKRTFANKTASAKEDSVVDAATAQMTLGFGKINYLSAPVDTTPVTTNPGGKASNPVTYSNLNGTTITGLSFDGKGASVNLITLNSCTNVHITLCRFSNTNGISIALNKCSNITVDYCFFTMVGFGVDAVSCTGGIKTNHNQGLNLWAPIKYNGNFAHWVQYYKSSGPGMEINDNAFQSIDGVAVHPHDGISIDLTSGTAASPIQIHDNKIRGGQIAGGFPNSGDTGVGITAPDEGGSYYDIRRNIVVNSGVNGMLCITTSASSNVVLDSNIIVNDNKAAKISYDGFTLTGAKSNYTVSNMRVRWLTDKGAYTGLWLGSSTATSSGKFTGVTFTNNNWNDATLTSAVLPANIITYK